VEAKIMNTYALLLKTAGVKIKWRMVLDKKTGNVRLDTTPQPGAPKACDAATIAVGKAAGLMDVKVVENHEQHDAIEDDVLQVDDQMQQEILDAQEPQEVEEKLELE